MKMKKIVTIFLFYVIMAVSKVHSSSSESSSNENSSEEREIFRKQAEDMVRDLAQDCKEHHNANDDDIDAMIRNDEDASYNSMCVRKCMMQNYELMSSEGKLCVDCVKELVGMIADGKEDIVKAGGEIAEKCSKIEEKDLCKAAFKYGMCMKNEAVKRGLYKE